MMSVSSPKPPEGDLGGGGTGHSGAKKELDKRGQEVTLIPCRQVSEVEALVRPSTACFEEGKGRVKERRKDDLAEVVKGGGRRPR